MAFWWCSRTSQYDRDRQQAGRARGSTMYPKSVSRPERVLLYCDCKERTPPDGRRKRIIFFGDDLHRELAHYTAATVPGGHAYLHQMWLTSIILSRLHELGCETHMHRNHVACLLRRACYYGICSKKPSVHSLLSDSLNKQSELRSLSILDSNFRRPDMLHRLLRSLWPVGAVSVCENIRERSAHVWIP
jgi:hypothetical protein